MDGMVGDRMDLWPPKVDNYALKVRKQKTMERCAEWGAKAVGRCVVMLPSQRDWRRISQGHDHVTITALR